MALLSGHIPVDLKQETTTPIYHMKMAFSLCGCHKAGVTPYAVGNTAADGTSWNGVTERLARRAPFGRAPFERREQSCWRSQALKQRLILLLLYCMHCGHALIRGVRLCAPLHARPVSTVFRSARTCSTVCAHMQKKKVIVVGAGFAGITAARTLLAEATAPLDVIVLEASSRVGGRACTTEVTVWDMACKATCGCQTLSCMPCVARGLWQG